MKPILNFINIIGEAAQDDQFTGLRSQGKIYVVVIVVAIVFIGIILYLNAIDSRLRKLEKKD